MVNSAFADTQTEVFNSTRFSPFNELLTIQRHNLIELKSTFGVSNLRDVIFTQNGGTVSTNNDGEFTLSTDSQSNSIARLESGEIGRYVPGYGAEIGIAARSPDTPTNDTVIEWGYFDENFGDGFYFSRDLKGIGVALRRNGNELRWPQEYWNIDRLDGTGIQNPSGLKLELNRGNIYQIIYSWYGYGDITWMVQVPLKNPNSTITSLMVPVHSYVPYEQTSLRDPNLPISAQIRNNSDTNPTRLYIAGRQYTILGNYEPSRRFTTEILRGLSVPDNGTSGPFTVATALKRKPGTSRGISLKLDSVNLISDGNLEYYVRSDVTGMDGTYGDIRYIKSSETGIEGKNQAGIGGGTAVTNSNDDGDAIIGDIISGGNKGGVSTGTGEVTFGLIREKPLVVLANSLSGNAATFTLVTRIREEW